MKVIRILGALVLAVMLVLCGCTQNDNAEFLDWVQVDLDYHSAAIDRLSDEVSSYKWQSVEIAAGEAEDYVSTVSEPKCDSFELSGDYIPLRDEYCDYLSDAALFYSNVKSAGRAMLDGQPDDASEALIKANDYASKATARTRTLKGMLNNF